MIDERKVIVIPPNPAVDEAARTQDYYRAIVADYRRRQRSRQLFGEIVTAGVFAALVSLILIGFLRLLGIL
jgi:hypothetical protein